MARAMKKGLFGSISVGLWDNYAVIHVVTMSCQVLDTCVEHESFQIQVWSLWHQRPRHLASVLHTRA